MLGVAGVLLRAPDLRADTIAFWSFDEASGGANGASVPGKFGGAFRPKLGAAAFVSGVANPTDSRLNLGAHDWTIECWLRLDPAATEEGVIFEIGTGRREAEDFVTRFSVLPRENAFAFSCLASAPAGLARRVEFPNPAGPPGVVAWRHSATLALSRENLPRATWFHVALVHDKATCELRLFIDGRPRAVAAVQVMGLPRGEEAYLAIGCDGASRRVLAGAIDELRVSDHAAYARAFPPPPSGAEIRPGREKSGSDRASPPVKGRRSLIINSYWYYSFNFLCFRYRGR